MHDDLRLDVSFISGVEDRRPVNYEAFPWTGIVNMLSQSEERTGKDGRAIIPAKFGEREYTRGSDGSKYTDVLRRKSAVEHISMGILDYDAGIGPKEAYRHFKHLGLEHVIYTTHSHTVEKPKFRVVIPFAETIEADVWDNVWLHLRDLATIDEHSIDLACSDAARLYYLPSHRAGTKPLFHHEPGELLVLPTTQHPDIQRALDKEKSRRWLASINVASYSSDNEMPSLGQWLSDNRVDCIQKPGDADVFQLQKCPWGSEHTKGLDGLGHAAVMDKGDKWGFACCHDTCIDNGRSWKDFRQLVAPKKETTFSEDFKLTFGRKKV